MKSCLVYVCVFLSLELVAFGDVFGHSAVNHQHKLFVMFMDHWRHRRLALFKSPERSQSDSFFFNVLNHVELETFPPHCNCHLKNLGYAGED